MEPDKTYSLHSDDSSQPGTSSTPAESQQDGPLEVPSKYGESKDMVSSQPGTTPWYLRPLTKTTESPLTSTQTRPFVPRQPLPPAQQQYQPKQSSPPAPDDQQRLQPQSSTVIGQPEPIAAPVVAAPPLSPFRSQSIIPSVPQRSWNGDRSSASLSSADRFQMPGQSKPPVYQEALSAAVPKPFSQFGAQAPGHAGDTTPIKPKKIRKLIGITLAVLLVGGISAGVYSLWRSNSTRSDPASPAVVASAEDKLYQAIENHLSTGRIRQVFEQTVTAADTSTFKIDATSDFSDPRAPKSHIKYELKAGEGETMIDGAGELTVLDPNEYYGKLTKPVLFYDGSETAKPKVNQWYAVMGSDSTGELLLDPLSARASINSSLGEFPVGSFGDGTRQQLMQYIRDQDVYRITSSEQVEIDGKKMTHYKIEFNADTVNELNKRIYTAIGGNADEVPITFTKNGTHQTELWVSDEDTKIARIKIGRESKTEGGDAVKEDITVNITYPNDVSTISEPEEAIAGGWAQAGR